MLDATVLIAILKTRIKAARLRAGLTQENMADALGHSVVYYQRFEGLNHRRTFNPTILTLFRLCDVLQIELDELVHPPTEDEINNLNAQEKPDRRG